MSTLSAAEQTEFASKVAAGLGAPATPQNIDWLRRWFARENTAATFNPLATTQQVAGSVPLPGNSAGVQQYPSLDAGVAATVKTLQNGRYPSIIMAIRSGNPVVFDAAGRLAGDFHTWSGHGYTSIYQTPVKDTLGKATKSDLQKVALGILGNDGMPGVGGLIDAGNSALGGVVDAASALPTIAGVVVKGAGWVANPHNWVRVAEVGAGLVAIFLGLHMLASTNTGPIAAAAGVPDKAAQAAADAAKTAAATAAKTATVAAAA